MIRRGRLAALLATGLLAACAQYQTLPPLGASHGIENLDADEQHLWKESLKLQHEIESSGLVFEDPELDAYLAQVLHRVAPPELAEAGITPRVVVLSDPQMHAYSFANGVIYIHTALLARLENETQLATVLTRELAHVTDRHAVRAFRDKRAQADTLAWVGVGSTLVDGGDKAKLLAQLASLTSIAGFHYVLETQADERGLETLHAAGYDVRATPDFFRMTVDYQRELQAQGPWAWAAFTPPPHMVARIAGYESLIARKYADTHASSPPIADPKTFRRKLQNVTDRQAELELASGLFLSAEKTARLATDSGPDDPRAWILLGRALQGQRDKTLSGRTPPAIHDVRAAYEQALAVKSKDPEATRELGMTYYRTNASQRTPEATRMALLYLRQYLVVAPSADDAAFVRSYVRKLEAEHGR
jgi:hypothetical protein